jgi:disulfide bond formation protein DsbB
MVKTFLKNNSVYLAWAVAFVAMIGSLYFQYVMQLPPCVLCWYQRIFMYPLVLVLLVGILRKDAKVHLYALPLSIIGMGIAIYHNLLYYNIIPESLAPCMQGVSCTTRQIEILGFITIPLLSLTAFIVITVLMVINSRNSK